MKADEITVAVASNFQSALKRLKHDFEQTSEHEVTIVSGSTGKLYAQILNGAPFDIFMSADKESVQRLEQNSIGVKGSQFIYAIGRLALWSAKSQFVDSEGAILFSEQYHKLAIANPKLAPYGRAAIEFIRNNQIGDSQLKIIESKIVRGENISQAFHLVSSGAAEIGFVALSQLINLNKPTLGSFWVVPDTKHQPIEQHAIVLNANSAVSQFIRFMKDKDARNVIESFGYQVPDLIAAEVEI